MYIGIYHYNKNAAKYIIYILQVQLYNTIQTLYIMLLPIYR